jgi:hypothetical protein
VQNGHPRDRAARLERNRIDGIVRANDECHIRVTEVVVYLVHLKHDCETDFFPSDAVHGDDDGGVGTVLS